MVKNRRRSTALKMACAGMLTALCLENVALGAFSVPVHAEDATADAVQMAGQIFWDSPAIKSLRRTLVTEYTSLDYNEIALIEWELGAGYQLMDYTMRYNNAIENGVEFSDSLGGSQCLTGICVYKDSNDLTVEDLGCITVTDNSQSFCSDGGNYLVYFVASSQYITLTSFSGGNGWDSYYGFTHIRKSGTVGDIQTIINCDGIFDFPSGLYVNFSSDIFVFQSAGYINNYPSLQLLNYYSRSLYGNTGSNFTQTNRPFYLLKMCNNGAVTYQQEDDPEEFLNKAKQDAVTMFGQNLVDELWVDLDFNDLPDTGNLDSLIFPPGLPSVDFNDVELPTEPLPAQMINGATFWFSSFSQMLDALGVKYIVITFLVIALVIAILKI